MESIQDCKEELFKIGKNGRPFKYPHSLILFLGILRVVFRLPYRVPDYTTLFLQIPKMDFKNLGYKPKGGEEVIIAVDATGVKVTKWQ